MATTQQVRLQDIVIRVATECKALRTLMNGNAADLSALTTAAKTSVVNALNELQGEITALAAASGAVINDASNASLTETYSITKIQDLVATSIAVLTTGAPAALNTLDELSAALGDDQNFATTITTALANRLRFDAAQALTAPQKAQAKTNMDAYGAAELGNPDTDLVAVFNTGLI